MKPNSLKPLQTALIVAFAAVIVAGIAALKEQDAKEDLIAERINLGIQAQEYDLLKKRWSLSESQELYRYLQKHPNVTKNEKRGGNITMQFDNLSALEFNRLSNKILNSTLVIKKLTLQRNSNAKGSIIVEFES